MLNGLTAHKYLLVFVLLTFLFSSNALSFGNHAAGEMLQAMNQLAAVPTLPAFSTEDTHAVFAHHHGHHDSGQSNHDSNESHHSHDTESAPLALTFAALVSSTLHFIEPFAWTPEVFFDRFIPPQNHA